MTRTIKTVITFAITVVMFAAMSANAFAMSQEQREVQAFTLATGTGHCNAQRQYWQDIIAYHDAGYSTGQVFGDIAYLEEAGSFIFTTMNYNGIETPIPDTTDNCWQNLDKCVLFGIVPTNMADVTQRSEVKAFMTADNRDNLLSTPFAIFTDVDSTSSINFGDRQVTREQLAIMLTNAAKYRGVTQGDHIRDAVTVSANEFTSEDGKKAAEFVIDTHLMDFLYEGQTAIEFDPQALVRTDEMLVACYNLHKVMQATPMTAEVNAHNAVIRNNPIASNVSSASTISATGRLVVNYHSNGR